jgi:4-hydroxythreonine-4-phosphate dehydrogenase
VSHGVAIIAAGTPCRYVAPMHRPVHRGAWADENRGMRAQTPPSPFPPPIAITMGDACGIGPEIIARLVADGRAGDCVVIGDLATMRRAAASTPGLPAVAALDRIEDQPDVPPNCVPVLQAPDIASGLAQVPLGRVDARAGAAAARCIEHAVLLAQRGAVRAIVTAPIHKEALAAAGVPYPGHTEMLQALAAEPGSTPAPVRMMLANDELRTVLVTIHLSLRDAIAAVTYDAVLATIRIAHRAAAGWGEAAPRIAVAGLNPHAGEGGLFGDEELRIIGPAVAAARAEGIDAQGPFAPDTVFMRARHPAGHAGEFDLVVAMTHDHGLIPMKYLGIADGVNVTLGLPFVRTSPDHGTAFDIAGTGRADAASLHAALRMARRLAAA